MTIITIRGTSGSGKSTLVRRIMELYADKAGFHIPRRKAPLYYNLWRESAPESEQSGPPLRVLGHYETATGGGDTISDGLDYIANLAEEGHKENFDILYEGLVISSDRSRITGFHERGIPTLVVILNTSLEECLESVRQRRAAKGNVSPLNPKATTEKHRAVLQMLPKFQAAGVDVHHLNREDAFQLVKTRLGFTKDA